MTTPPVLLIVILLGPPGSGKGTVAEYLKDKYGDVCHFSTGNLLRDEIKRESEIGLKVKGILGSGGLVDDSVVNEIVEKNINEINGGKIVLLDGYPRTVGQARALDEMMSGELKSKIHVIELEVDKEEIVSRISLRRVCEKCGSTYGFSDRIENCSCGGNLIKRKDDEESTVRNRLEKYEEETLPVAGFYSDRLVKVPGVGTPEEVAQKVDEAFCRFKRD